MNLKLNGILKVTKNHIRRGIREDESLCPIGRALSGQRFENVTVDIVDITFETRSGSSIRIKTPPNAKKFIKAFDKLGPKAVKPISIKLSI